jgi:hypothetical protein
VSDFLLQVHLLGEQERDALIKVIDMAIANKKLKDNLSNLLDV